MVKVESSESKEKILTARASAGVLGLLMACLALLPTASAQTDFTLTAAQLKPDAVAEGGTTFSNITIGAVGSFSGTVNLSCQVTPAAPNSNACVVSPATVTAPGQASATVTTTSKWNPGSYTITITASDSSGTQSSALNLTVLTVPAQFTITVQTVVQPSSVPAGNGGEGVISVNPIAGYVSPGYPNSGVTLSCSSITPLVPYSPVCSFTYPPDHTSLPVNGAPATATLTITTFGPVLEPASVVRARRFYALWLPLPMLGLVGMGAALGGKRSRKAWILLALFVVSGSLLLMPACGNTSTQTTEPNGVTPNETYTFTVMGVDAAGNVSSNTATGNSASPAVTLTVTSPTT